MTLIAATDVVHQTIRLESLPAAIVTAVAVPDQAAFTNLTVKHWVFSTPQTPTVTLVQAAPQIGSLQVRVRGYDPRDLWIEETTPLLSIVAKTTNHIYLSRVFRRVVEVAYIASGMSVGATIAVGQLNDLARLNSGATEHLAPANFGFWVPGQTSSRKEAGPFQLGERCDDSESRAFYSLIWNLTKQALWLSKIGAEQIGVNVGGWQGADDKVDFDLTKFEHAHGGAVPFLLSDSMEIYLATITQDRN